MTVIDYGLHELRGAVVPGGGRAATLSLNDFLAHNAVFNPMDFLATGDGAADDYAALVGTHAAGPVTINHPHRINANLTITNALHVREGGKLKPAAGVTVTIKGPVRAGQFAWIDLSLGGAVKFTHAAGATPAPRWWGAKGDYDHATGLGTDDAAAFQAMAAALSGGVSDGWTFDFGVGAYYLTAGMVFTAHATTVQCHGIHATQLVFDPAADGARLITFDRGGGAELFLARITGGLGIYAKAGNTRQKIAIDVVDVSEPHLEEINIHNSWTSTGRSAIAPSIGLRVKGREALHTQGLTIAADRPTHITSNPNHQYDFDVVSMRDSYFLILAAAEAAMKIDSGTYIQNFVFTGSNIFTGGKDGIYFEDAAGASEPNRMILIENIRHESTVTAGGSLVRIKKDASQGLSVALRGLQPSFDQNIYLRGCNHVDVEKFTFSGVVGKTPVDIDDCNYVYFRDLHVQPGNTVSMGAGMRLVYAIGERTSVAHEPEALYVKTATAARARFVGASADDGTAGIEVENTNGRKFRLVSGIPGVSNNGFTVYDQTNGKKVCWLDNFDTLHAGGIWVEIEGVGGAFIARSPDGTRYKLAPPNGGGAAAWVAA